MKIYVNGSYYKKEEARVSVYDHGLLYGDGIFEGIRVYNGKAFKLTEHIDRLYSSARSLMIDIPQTSDEMLKLVNESIAINGRDGEGASAYIRLVVTRGTGDLGLDPKKCPDPTLIIIVDDIKLYPEAFYTKGIEVVTASVRRNSGDVLDPKIKSLNYLNNILAKIEANNKGLLEALLLNQRGHVAECTGDNIFIVKEGVLLTPPVSDGALDGITRQTVIELAAEKGIECHEKHLTLFDLYNSDECFLTGTAAEIMAVTKLDGRVIGEGEPGALTEKIRELYLHKVG